MDDKMSLVYNIIFKINFIVQRDRRLQKITPKVAVFQIPKGKVQGLDFTWGGGEIVESCLLLSVRVK